MVDDGASGPRAMRARLTDAAGALAGTRARLPERVAAGALVVLALLVLARSQGFDGVVFGGDEYAYLARALFPGELLARTDPSLQQVSNHGYLALVRLANAGPARLQLVHLWGAVAYAIGGVFTVLLARRFLDRLGSLLVGVLYFLLPTTAWVSSVMPEPVYAGLFAVVAYLVLRPDGRLRARDALGAGLAIGVLFSVKPHAIAVLLGTCAFAAIAGLAPRGGGARAAPRTLRSLSAAALVVAGFWIAATLAAGILGGAWAASPRALVGGLYGGAVSGAVSSSFWSAASPAVLRYAAGHLVLLCMLFGVPLALVVADGSRALRQRAAPGEAGALAPGLLALLVLGAAVAMTCIFTAQAGAANPFEAGRLHVRYYSFALPLAALAGLAALRGRRPDAAVRVGGAVMIAATIAFALVSSRAFKLYPWDAADVFALFDPTNRYWGFARALPPWVRHASLGVLAAAGLVVALRPRWAAPVLVGTWVLLFAAGNLSVYRWQRVHVRGVSARYQEARAFSTLVRERGLGSGAIVGRERYGTMAYSLAGLANAPHVRVLDGGTITAADLPPEASWVVAVDRYVPEFAYEAAVEGEVLTLYLLARGGPPAIRGRPAEASTAPGVDR